jgi:hypothetical protein
MMCLVGLFEQMVNSLPNSVNLLAFLDGMKVFTVRISHVEGASGPTGFLLHRLYSDKCFK